MLLLHGWPEFWYSWRNQLPVLGESYRAIAPDMRGFGYSDKPLSGYDTRTAAAIRERWHSYFHQQFDLPEKLIEGREEIYLRHIFRDWCINKYPISDEDVAHYVKAYSQPGALRGGFSYYRAAAYEDPPDWRADAERQMDTPMLFLFGVRRARTAEVMGAGPLAEAWRRFFPNAVGKDLGNYGHFLQWETPEAVNRELVEFLRG